MHNTRKAVIEWAGTGIGAVYCFEAAPDPVQPDIWIEPPPPKSHRRSQLSRAAQGREARRLMIEKAMSK